MGVYKVLRSFQCDGYYAKVGQYIDVDDDWAANRLNANVDTDLEPDALVFAKRVPPKQIPPGQKVWKIDVGEKGALARTKPVREGSDRVETKPVRG